MNVMIQLEPMLHCCDNVCIPIVCVFVLCISIVVVVFITIVIYDDIILVCVILLLLSMFDVLYSHVSIVIFIFGAKGVLD